MQETNIDQIIQEMSEKSKKTNEEIQGLIQEKISKFSGLLTEQGAIFMVKKELGIGIETKEDVPLSQIENGMKGIEVTGTIETIYPTKEFEKNGKTGKLKSFIITDGTGEARVTLWNEQIEKYELTKGSEIKITNALISQYNEKKQINLGFNGGVEVINKKEEVFTPLSELKNARTEVNLLGRIMRKYPCKEFENKERKGKLCSFQISDGSAVLRATAWNEKAGEIEKFSEGNTIEIRNAYTKEGIRGIEIHLGYSAIINNTTREIPSTNEIMKKNTFPKKISELTLGENTIISGNILSIEKGNLFYEICANCNKKINKTNNGVYCETCGETKSKKNPVLSIILQDDSGEIKTILFRENALIVIEETQEELEKKLNEKPSDLLIAELNGKLIGKKMTILGYLKTNQYTKNNEFIAREVI